MGVISEWDCANHQASDTNEVEGDDLRSEVEAEITSPAQVQSRTRFRYMIYEFVRLGYNVALVNGLEFKDTKVRLPSVVVEYRVLDYDCVRCIPCNPVCHRG